MIQALAPHRRPCRRRTRPGAPPPRLRARRLMPLAALWLAAWPAMPTRAAWPAASSLAAWPATSTLAAWPASLTLAAAPPPLAAALSQATPAALPLPFNLWHPHLPAWAERWLYNPGERTREAIAAAGRGDAKAAVPPADTALRLAPDSPLARYNAGTAHLASGDGRGAVPLLDQAAKAAGPGLTAAASYNLGNARLAAGDYAAAVEAYKQALRATPADAAAKFNLELALQQQKKQQQSSMQGPGPRGGGGRPRQGDQQHTAGQGGSGNAGTNPQAGQSDQRGRSQQQGQHPGQNGDQQGATSGQQGMPQQKAGQQPLAGYRDQPEMSASEAAAVLESVQNMERQQRRLAAARQVRQRAANGEDW
jgi:tetratricopeptide (TPR) repeat protein